MRDLKTYLYTRRGTVKAVDGVSFSLRRGESLAIVGESGSGKTMTALSLLRLLPRPAGRIVGGEVVLLGEDLIVKNENEMERIRGSRISMILQDPITALNPVLTVGFQVQEPLQIHQRLRGSALLRKATETLRLMRIASPESRLRAYPHQMSGGMRQRVVGGIALSCAPAVLIADEPTTSLDITIQAQYLKLLRDVQRETGMALIFITHDFGIVAQMCEQVAIMYAGKIVERGPVAEIFDRPAHPYTRALLAAVPRLDVEVDRLVSIDGQPPALHRLPPGCSFAPRCSFAVDECRVTTPADVELSREHYAKCLLAGRLPVA